MYELKPCPFCGSEEVVYKFEYEVVCAMCKTCGATGSKHFAIDDASEAWNRRAEDGK